MAPGNGFRHQLYTSARPSAALRWLSPTPEEARNSPCVDKVAALRASWGALEFDRIYLVHGTFTGNDVLGVLRTLGRYQPKLAASWRRVGKQWIDQWTGDVGNFSPHYAAELSGLIAVPRTGVTRFAWSGENHHTGRCLAVLELLHCLVEDMRAGRGKILLWGHSHAGNLFALLTNLLGGDSEARRTFCAALRTQPTMSRFTAPMRAGWELLTDSLEQPRWNEGLALHIVTFGTPVRYGWETRGYHRLLHLVHHRPVPDHPPWLARFPFSWDELLEAKHGDYVQQIGIAGTDFVPSLFSYHDWLLERRLCRLLQPGLRRRDTLARLHKGTRVHDAGMSLLVDYPREDGLGVELIGGHAVYTDPRWLPFHLELLGKLLGSLPGDSSVERFSNAESETRTKTE